jgi:hypothetical protein
MSPRAVAGSFFCTAFLVLIAAILALQVTDRPTASLQQPLGAMPERESVRQKAMKNSPRQAPLANRPKLGSDPETLVRSWIQTNLAAAARIEEIGPIMTPSEWQAMLQDAGNSPEAESYRARMFDAVVRVLVENVDEGPNSAGRRFPYVEYLFEVCNGTVRISASDMALASPGGLNWKDSLRRGLAKKFPGIRPPP